MVREMHDKIISHLMKPARNMMKSWCVRVGLGVILSKMVLVSFTKMRVYEIKVLRLNETQVTFSKVTVDQKLQL